MDLLPAEPREELREPQDHELRRLRPLAHLMGHLLGIADDLLDMESRVQELPWAGVKEVLAPMMVATRARLQEAFAALEAVVGKLYAPGTTPDELYRAERNAAALAEAAISGAVDLLVDILGGPTPRLKLIIARAARKHHEHYAKVAQWA